MSIDPRKAARALRQFVVFSAFSGVGWLCDFVTFLVLAIFFGGGAFWANFVSSYVGVTFVWFASLKAVFGCAQVARSRLIFAYWGYQLLSILVYSEALRFLENVMKAALAAQLLVGASAILAKCAVTPFNLITNFVFMKCLMQCMHRNEAKNV